VFSPELLDEGQRARVERYDAGKADPRQGRSGE
jgi:hypothetical protein